jgi:hypothetical protein
MTKHLSLYFVYRHPFYINNVPTVGKLTLLLNCLRVIQNSKKAPPTVEQTSFAVDKGGVHISFEYCFYFFYSNRLIWGGARLCGDNNSTTSSCFVFRRLSIFWSSNGCSLDSSMCLTLRSAFAVQIGFLANLSMLAITSHHRIAQRFLCLSQSARLSLCAQVIDWCFCVRVFPDLAAMLV